MMNLIHRRNKLAKYLKNIEQFNGDFNFPKMIDNPGECNRCFVSSICSVVNQTIENKTRNQVESYNIFKKRKAMTMDLRDIEEFEVNNKFKIYHEIKGNIIYNN